MHRYLLTFAITSTSSFSVWLIGSFTLKHKHPVTLLWIKPVKVLWGHKSCVSVYMLDACRGCCNIISIDQQCRALVSQGQWRHLIPPPSSIYCQYHALWLNFLWRYQPVLKPWSLLILHYGLSVGAVGFFIFCKVWQTRARMWWGGGGSPSCAAGKLKLALESRDTGRIDCQTWAEMSL